MTINTYIKIRNYNLCISISAKLVFFKQPHTNTMCICMAARPTKYWTFREEGTGRRRMEYFYILIISIKVVQFDILRIVKCQCFSLYSPETHIIITKLSLIRV